MFQNDVIYANIPHIAGYFISICVRRDLSGDAFYTILKFHTAKSIGFKSVHLHKYFDVNYLVGSLPRKLCASPLLLYFPLPPTSIPVIKLHVVWALGFCSELISLGVQKLKAHWLQSADSGSTVSQQPVAMVTSAQWQADAVAA